MVIRAINVTMNVIFCLNHNLRGNIILTNFKRMRPSLHSENVQEALISQAAVLDSDRRNIDVVYKSLAQ